MGVILKSVVGLGSVYIAMFAPEAPSHNVEAIARLCGDAAKARLEQSQVLRADIALASCTLALTSPVQRPESLDAAPPPPAPPPVRRRIGMGAGTLTEADLQDTWYGPTEHSRKARWPG